MRFCSNCGARVALRWISNDYRQRYVCSACGFVHYENPKALVLCLAHWGDRVLMCRRAYDPALGLWNAPAGFVELGETLEQAAARETREETGVTVRPSDLRLCFVASLAHIDQIYVGFRVGLQERPRTKPGTESLEVALFAEQELRNDELAFGEILVPYYRAFFEQLRLGRFSVVTVQIANRFARSEASGTSGCTCTCSTMTLESG